MATGYIGIEPEIVRISGGQITVYQPSATSTLIHAGAILVQDSHGTSTPSQFLVTVTTPPTHGYITLNGVPASQFTQDDINNNRVLYESYSGPVVADTFSVYATATRVPGVLHPYTPQMTGKDFGTQPGNPVPMPDVGASYIGIMVVGANNMPPVVGDYSDPNYVYLPSTPGPVFTQPMKVTDPNSIVLLSVTTQNSLRDPPNPSAPAACTVVSVTCPGLTFTRVAGATIVRTHADEAGRAWVNHVTSTQEVWWAPAPTPMTGTLTVTLSANAPQTSAKYIYWTTLFGVANPSAPFDTNASNFSVSIGTPANMPMVVAPMTPNAPDTSVGLIYAQLEVNGYVAEVAHYTMPPGYWTAMGIGGGIGDTGAFNSQFSKRDLGYITIPIVVYVPPPPPVVTEAELFFEPQSAFFDLSVITNRRKFVTADGNPVWMERDGSLPFDTVPAIYLTTLKPPEDFYQNNGDGGPFQLLRYY